MDKFLTPTWRAILARAGWSGLAALVAFLVTVQTDVFPTSWLPAIAVVLSAAKSFIASKIGEGSSLTFSGSSIEATGPSTPLEPTSRGGASAS